MASDQKCITLAFCCRGYRVCLLDHFRHYWMFFFVLLVEIRVPSNQFRFFYSVQNVLVSLLLNLQPADASPAMKSLCAKICFISKPWKIKYLRVGSTRVTLACNDSCLPHPLQKLCKVLDRFHPYFTDCFQALFSLLFSTHSDSLAVLRNSWHFEVTFSWLCWRLVPILPLIETCCPQQTWTDQHFNVASVAVVTRLFSQSKVIFFKSPLYDLHWVLCLHTQKFIKKKKIRQARITRILAGCNLKT